jgi:GNAT superfamily N-acetyltransferase
MNNLMMNLECAEVQPITLNDLTQLVELHCKYLNYGEGIRPHFESALRDEATIALKYVMDGEILGIVIYTKGITFSGGHPELCRRVQQLTGGELTYTGDALLVREEHRGKGIPQKLYCTLVEELRQQKVCYTVNELWVYPDGRIPARGVIRTLGDALYIGHYDNFYKDFYHYGYVCPICGRDCICSADIYLCKIK